MTRIQTILHPTDYSEYAAHAFQLACALARDYGAKLLLLYVEPSPIVPPSEGAHAPPASHDHLREQLDALRPEDPRIAIERYWRTGDEADEIVKLAQEQGCDLIVMGTHGRTGLSRLLMGSVAEVVLRRAPCPVLTVKQPFPATEPRP